MKFLNLFLSAQLLGSIAFAQIKINPIRSNGPGLPIKAERTITISTNESVSIKESTTVKAMQIRSLAWTRDTEMGLLPDWTRNMEAPRASMEAPRTTAGAASA